VESHSRRTDAAASAGRAADRARRRLVQAAGVEVAPAEVGDLVERLVALRAAEEAWRTARAAHDEASALAEGPAPDEPLLVAPGADEGLLERLLQASGRCPVVVVSADPAVRDWVQAHSVSGRRPKRRLRSVPTSGPEGDPQTPEPGLEPDEPEEPDSEEPIDLRDRVLATLRRAMAIPSPARRDAREPGGPGRSRRASGQAQG